MATQVRTFGFLIGTGGPVGPGGSQGWWATAGTVYGRTLWFEAHPLAGPPGSKSFEVRHKRANESGGNRTFTCSVVNVGSVTASYALFAFFTDSA